MFKRKKKKNPYLRNLKEKLQDTEDKEKTQKDRLPRIGLTAVLSTTTETRRQCNKIIKKIRKNKYSSGVIQESKIKKFLYGQSFHQRHFHRMLLQEGP